MSSCMFYLWKGKFGIFDRTKYKNGNGKERDNGKEKEDGKVGKEGQDGWDGREGRGMGRKDGDGNEKTRMTGWG